MRADVIRAPFRRANYEPYEDVIVASGISNGLKHEAIAEQLFRSPKSVQQRVAVLRRDGVIPGYTPRRKIVVVDTRPIPVAPPLALRNDDILVRLSLAYGGFPKAVITSAGTAWAGPDGMPWRYVSWPKEEALRA